MSTSTSTSTNTGTDAGTGTDCCPGPDSDTVAVLCGGVGAARFLGGLQQVVDPARITAIVNTGDDTQLNGLFVMPDLDTITYTLAGAIDPGRGWGLVDESWQAMAALARYQQVRPPESDAATTWFGLGDRDLATHLYRTVRRFEGATLTTIAAEIAAAWGLAVTLLPMSEGPRPTVIVQPDGATLAFQEYFVREHHAVTAAAVEFGGDAPATAAVLDTLAHAPALVIAPSNPIVSIGPIRALPAVEQALQARRERTVAISPIVGGRALKGPADRLLRELGHEPTVVGVARIYAPIAAHLVIDTVDAELADDVAAAGITPVIAESVMSTPARAAALAAATLAAFTP